jgi:S-adenosyl-L-methionine hydrolase (adenosine-forming)
MERTPGCIITLLTDFGDTDGYVGSMVGALLSICRTATPVSISHRIQPYNVNAAAFVLSRYWSFYPAGTIHLVIIDPGVGSARKAIAVEADNHFFLAPDNGVLSYIFQQTYHWTAYEIINAALFLPQVSVTFHGRDIFAPVAAHLANGVGIDQVGPKLLQPKRLRIEAAVTNAHGIVGQIIYTDTFGNCITNIPATWLSDKNFRLKINTTTISHISASYSESVTDELLLIEGSAGYLEIAVNQGNAAKLTGLKPHDPVEIEIF